MKLRYARKASNNPVIRVFIPNSASTTGAGLTGLTSSSAGLCINVIRELDATPTLYKQSASNIETISTLGTYAAPTSSKCRFKEVDATELPGIYEIHFAQALFGTGDASRFISGLIFGATNVLPTAFEIQLDAFDSQDSVRGGLTALPNAAAEAAGGLYTRGTGAGQINQPANGMIDANLVRIANNSSVVTEWLAALKTIASFTISGTPTTTVIAASSLPGTIDDDGFKGRTLVILSDSSTAGIRFQATYITAYDGAAKEFTVSPALTTAPSSGDTGVVL